MQLAIIIQILLGISSILSFIFTLLTLFQTGQQMIDVVSVLSGGSSEMLTLYDTLLSKLGIDFSSMFSSIDAALSGVTSKVCTPECTVTYLLKISGMGFFLRGCLYCLISVAIFRFNAFMLKMCLVRMANGGIIGIFKGKK